MTDLALLSSLGLFLAASGWTTSYMKGYAQLTLIKYNFIKEWQNITLN